MRAAICRLQQKRRETSRRSQIGTTPHNTVPSAGRTSGNGRRPFIEETKRSAMNIKRILLALLPLVLIAATEAGPTLDIESDGVRIRGLAAGQQLVWTGIVRTSDGSFERVKVVRGIGTVDASGDLSIDATIADGARTEWLLSSLDPGAATPALRVGTNAEADPEEIKITPGTGSVFVEAAAIDFVYIHNGHAYYFWGADGSSRDTGPTQDGIVEVVLKDMLKFPLHAGDPPPPQQVSAGDKIQVIDLYEYRKTNKVVPE
jgi:hypothetical protein